MTTANIFMRHGTSLGCRRPQLTRSCPLGYDYPRGLPASVALRFALPGSVSATALRVGFSVLASRAPLPRAGAAVTLRRVLATSYASLPLLSLTSTRFPRLQQHQFNPCGLGQLGSNAARSRATAQTRSLRVLQNRTRAVVQCNAFVSLRAAFSTAQPPRPSSGPTRRLD